MSFERTSANPQLTFPDPNKWTAICQREKKILDVYRQTLAGALNCPQCVAQFTLSGMLQQIGLATELIESYEFALSFVKICVGNAKKNNLNPNCSAEEAKNLASKGADELGQDLNFKIQFLKHKYLIEDLEQRCAIKNFLPSTTAAAK